MLGAEASTRDEYFVGQTQLSCGGNASSFCHVGDDNGDFDVLQAAFANRPGDGEEVGAATGEENAEAESWPDGRTGALRALSRGIRRVRIVTRCRQDNSSGARAHVHSTVLAAPFGSLAVGQFGRKQSLRG